ncbi:MAG: signal transduction histidine kinase, partial [Gammaproteobacteria bacterium]
RRIAELQRLNVELDEAKRIKEQLIMQSPLAIIQTDLAANIEDVNPAGQQLFARSLDQLLGTRVQRYLGHWDRALPELRQLADNDRGRTVQVFPGAQPERIADLMVTFLRSPTAELIGYYITLNDVTESIRERHRRELEDKVQGIHRTSRVIAHDFSHLLIGIRGAIERARSTGASDDLGLAYDAAVSGVQRGQDMLRQMGAGQAFAKPKLAVTSLNAIVSEAVQIYRAAALDRSIEVTFDDVDDVLVNVDPAQMVRVFTNLLGNAMRVVPVGGRVRIEFVPEKYGVTAKVIDNGPGMTLKQIEQAIDPGFSTKGEGSGGLGLAISYLMVEAHGGRFAIEAVPEGGLAALVWLPIATEMDMQSDRSDARLIVHLRDSVLAESVVAAWERQGASAVETRSNEEVNALLKYEAEHWDTLLSDSDELPRARHCTSFQLHGNTLQLTRPGERTEDECERLRQQIEISAFGRMRH